MLCTVEYINGKQTSSNWGCRNICHVFIFLELQQLESCALTTLFCLTLPSQIEKEPGFGNFRFNHNLLGDHVPSMFSNGERHKQQKAFLIAVSQNMLRMGRHIPNIMDIMPEHFIKWNFKEGKLNYIPCPFF